MQKMAMIEKEWSHLWHHRLLNVSYLQAYYAVHAYPRHSHDYYVIAVVDSGLQSFTNAGARYMTPVDGLILLNPGDVHTGEPVDEQGFRYRALYPTSEHMETLRVESGGHSGRMPFFPTPRADDPQMARWLRALFTALHDEDNWLEAETRFLFTLVELMSRFGGQRSKQPKTGIEHRAVRHVRDYIHEHYARPISLAELADYVHFSRYYLLHTFRDEIGMPPHRYLENVRVRHAQRLLTEGEPLAGVAQQVGFSSQSHFTRRFKQIIGVTPGIYAQQFR